MSPITFKSAIAWEYLVVYNLIPANGAAGFSALSVVTMLQWVSKPHTLCPRTITSVGVLFLRPGAWVLLSGSLFPGCLFQWSDRHPPIVRSHSPNWVLCDQWEGLSLCYPFFYSQSSLEGTFLLYRWGDQDTGSEVSLVSSHRKW